MKRQHLHVLKKYTLSDNMCLIHISAIVMLTVMRADIIECIIVYAVVKVAYEQLYSPDIW